MLPCAGVVVVAPDYSVAIVYSAKGYPSFPKGKRERGDASAWACARRELYEETGLQQEVGDVWERDLTFLERTGTGTPVCLYYVLYISQSRPLVYDADEDIHSAAWVPLDRLHQLDWKSNRVCTVREITDYLTLRRQLHYELSPSDFDVLLSQAELARRRVVAERKRHMVVPVTLRTLRNKIKSCP